MVSPGSANRAALPEEGERLSADAAGHDATDSFPAAMVDYSDPVMEEALHDVPLLRRFAGQDAFEDVMPDESTTIHFRHLLEQHDLATPMFAEVAGMLSEKGLTMKRGSVVDATLIAAPSSTKNQEQEHDPEMTQTKNGNQWHFGMKAHIGVDAKSGLIHTVECTTAKVADRTMMDACLHGKETVAFGDLGYHKAANRTIGQFEKEGDLSVITPTKKPACGKLTDEQKAFNRMLLAVRAIVEHPFRVIGRQFGFTKVRYRGLKKNTGQIVTLFALASVAGAQTIVAPLGRGSPVKREVRGRFLRSCVQQSNIACFASFL